MNGQMTFDGDEDGADDGRNPLDVPAHERRHKDPHETERDASESVDNVAIAWECLRLYDKHRGGLTDDELGALAGAPDHKHQSYRRRGSDLRPLGLIEWLFDDGDPPKIVKRRTNKGKGAPSGVCVITAKGIEVLRTGIMPERPKKPVASSA